MGSSRKLPVDLLLPSENSPAATEPSVADGYPEYQLFNSLIFKINRLSSLYFKSSSRYYQREFGMGVPEVRLLNIVGSLPWAAAQQVVELSSMDKGLVSRALANLIKRGHLRRLPDPQDRRRLVLKLTASGEEVYGRITAAKRSRHLRAVSGLTPAECLQLYRLLDKALRTAAEMAASDGATESRPVGGQEGYTHSWPPTGLIDYVADIDTTAGAGPD